MTKKGTLPLTSCSLCERQICCRWVVYKVHVWWSTSAEVAAFSWYFLCFSLLSCHNWDCISPFVSPVLTNYGAPIYSIIFLLLNTWTTSTQKSFIVFSPTNMLSPCELLTWETYFNRPCVACVQGQHPSSPQLFGHGLSSTLHWVLCSLCASLLLGRLFWFGFFFNPTIIYLWHRGKSSFRLNGVREDSDNSHQCEDCKWLTVNSSLPRLLAVNTSESTEILCQFIHAQIWSANRWWHHSMLPSSQF